MNVWPITFCSPEAFFFLFFFFNARIFAFEIPKSRLGFLDFSYWSMIRPPERSRGSSKLLRGPSKGVGSPLLIFQRQYPPIIFKNITHHRKFLKERVTIILPQSIPVNEDLWIALVHLWQCQLLASWACGADESRFDCLLNHGLFPIEPTDFFFFNPILFCYQSSRRWEVVLYALSFFSRLFIM